MYAKKSYHHGALKEALIGAGAEILARDGASGLTLRKVARQAGVSHAAPYAHFTDKQALIAAISTAGFRRLYDLIGLAIEKNCDDPRRMLVEAALGTMQFALAEPDLYRVMFSGVLDREKDYPEYVAVSHQNFQQLVEIVRACQIDGTLRSGPAEAMAVSIWSAVHGFVSLLLEGQISHTVLETYSVKDLLLFVLSQFIQENPAG